MTYLRRVFLVLGVILCFTVTNFGHTTTSSDIDRLGLSDYRYFLVYPHLNKAFTALNNRNEVLALQEFEKALSLAPDNKQLTLYLVEAYRSFNKHELADKLIFQQLRQYPELQGTGEFFTYQNVDNINSIEQLRNAVRSCYLAPTNECRYFVGMSAISLDQIDIAAEQFEDEAFSKSNEGLLLQNEVLHKAIFLKDWEKINKILYASYLANTLSENMMKTWFYALLQGQQDVRILELQNMGLFNSIDDHISYMNALHKRKEKEKLKKYLSRSIPIFETADQEKSWIFLMDLYLDSPQFFLENYVIKFQDNQQNYINMMLPWYIENKKFHRADILLRDIGKENFVRERYLIELNLRDNNLIDMSYNIYAENQGNFEVLDELTWNLINSNKKQQALQMLLVEYPKLPHYLMQRVFNLVNQEQLFLSDEDKMLLARPLSTVQYRMEQSKLNVFKNDCDTLKNIVLINAELSLYDINTLMSLSSCYNKESAEQTLYILEAAYQKQAELFILKSIAYQLFALGEYQRALEVWGKIPLQSLSDDEVIAAAVTADMLQDKENLLYWLNKLTPTFKESSADYWRLHAKTHSHENIDLSIDDLTKALSYQPTAELYRERAILYRVQGDRNSSKEDYQESLRLNPSDKNTKIELGYLLWDMKKVKESAQVIEEVYMIGSQSLELEKHLVYANSYLGNTLRVQYYAQKVIDDYSSRMEKRPEEISTHDIQALYNFRRVHEMAERKWVLNWNSALGLLSNGTEYGVEYNDGSREQYSDGRSYTQLEIEYKIGDNQLVNGDVLAVYGRLSGSTGATGGIIPVKHMRLGLGVRWKPLREQIIFLAAEAQIPTANLMLRASASFFNDGNYSDEWHPNGDGWFSQNLYLDAAYYVSDYVRSWTIDYRISWHQKFRKRSTIEPYIHVQKNGYHNDRNVRKTTFIGVGTRWNIWFHENHYNAWKHKVSIGVEYQRALNYENTRHQLKNRNKILLTLNIDL